MEKFRVGQIGLGGRGMGHLSGIFCERDDVVVTYVCDVYEDRCAAAVKMVEEKNGNTPKSTTNYKEVCESPDVGKPHPGVCLRDGMRQTGGDRGRRRVLH